ncbi:MAG: hypothetical protein IIX54_02215 [Clostridia bacterium]|nr:hypothetical protein [Clostridia bacterium]
MKYITKYRIRWWVSAFFQIVLFVFAFLPMVTIVAIEQNAVNVDSVSRSALWYLAEAGFPGFYITLLTLFTLFSVPVLCLGFRYLLKPASLLVAAITDIVYLVVNTFWSVFVYVIALYGDFSTTVSFTAWFYIGAVINILQIVHLFILFFQIKKARV